MTRPRKHQRRHAQNDMVKDVLELDEDRKLDTNGKPKGGRAFMDVYIRDDTQIADENRKLFQTRRGRTCEYPECPNRVRYSKDLPFCNIHELTELAQSRRTVAYGEGAIRFPRLPGLRAARLRRGLNPTDFSRLMGKNDSWTRALEGGRNGTDEATRKRIARALDVSERELLEGAGNVEELGKA